MKSMYDEDDRKKETPGRVIATYEDPWTGKDRQVCDPTLQGINGVKIVDNGRYSNK